MAISVTNSNSYNRLFYLFIIFHLICWTLFPTLIRYHLPMDTIEGALWGNEWQWGYDKNPYLSAWVTAAVVKLSNYQDGFIYFTSQAAIVLCFFATWKLAKKIVPESCALLSILLLEGIQYYHLHSIDLSDNLLELTTWSLTIYSFYCACKGSRMGWLATGAFAGLAMMVKYYSGFLLLSLAIFLLSNKASRKQLKTIFPYLGLVVFLIIILPHLYWLINHDYITIKYMLTRTESVSSWKNHFIFPGIFLYEQFIIFLPALILYGVCLLTMKPHQAFSVNEFDKKFLIFAAVLPLAFTVICSLLFGFKLHAAWGSPLMTLWPLCLLIFYKTPNLNLLKTCVITFTIIVLISILALFYSKALIYPTTKTTANFVGKFLAEELTDEWHKRFGTKLSYVAGDRFLAGSIFYYSPDHPSVWIEWSRKSSPWINEEKLKTAGAIFIYYAENSLPQEVQNNYSLIDSREISLPWWRTSKAIGATNIRVIFIPPKVV